MQISHAHIVSMYSWWEDEDRVYMVLELQPGDLSRTLITRGQLTEEGTVLDVLVPLLDALIYLHKRVRMNASGEWGWENNGSFQETRSVKLLMRVTYQPGPSPCMPIPHFYAGHHPPRHQAGEHFAHPGRSYPTG